MSVYPMVVLVQMSLSDVTLSDILTSWPWNAFANFRYIFDSSTFQEVAAQTVIFVVVVLVATMLAGFIVALVLRSPRGFSLVTSTTLVLVWVMPPVIVGSLWRFLLSSNGAVNSLLLALRIEREPTAFLALPGTALGAIAAVTVWVGIPFASLVIKSAILDVSEEVLDAARVDGANSWETLTRIVIPMIRSTLLILAVLTVVGAFKAFDLIYTMTKGGPGTKSATIPFLGYVTAFQSYQFGNAAAMSAVAMAFILILAVLYIVVTRKEEKG
ncbi:MAG: sugar ABC transporter permease [Micrococcales bacterium]|nr:sugar ABC transporter permease [Micrococcales bacterium]